MTLYTVKNYEKDGWVYKDILFPTNNVILREIHPKMDPFYIEHKIVKGNFIRHITEETYNAFMEIVEDYEALILESETLIN